MISGGGGGGGGGEGGDATNPVSAGVKDRARRHLDPVSLSPAITLSPRSRFTPPLKEG